MRRKFCLEKKNKNNESKIFDKIDKRKYRFQFRCTNYANIFIIHVGEYIVCVTLL